MKLKHFDSRSAIIGCLIVVLCAGLAYASVNATTQPSASIPSFQTRAQWIKAYTANGPVDLRAHAKQVFSAYYHAYVIREKDLAGLSAKNVLGVERQLLWSAQMQVRLQLGWKKSESKAASRTDSPVMKPTASQREKAAKFLAKMRKKTRRASIYLAHQYDQLELPGGAHVTTGYQRYINRTSFGVHIQQPPASANDLFQGAGNEVDPLVLRDLKSNRDYRIWKYKQEYYSKNGLYAWMNGSRPVVRFSKPTTYFAWKRRQQYYRDNGLTQWVDGRTPVLDFKNDKTYRKYEYLRQYYAQQQYR